MKQKTAEDCDSTCFGTEEDLQAIRSSMLEINSVIQMADWFKAFSDPTRVRIIDALMKKELCVHDLTVILDMGQSAVSHQLRFLRNLRIVKRRKEGKTVFYSLDDTHIEQIFLQTLQHLGHQ
ncbi:metalloregulator ArsR/SmtB family transcription factor [Paenibacillus sp. JX-17]|uniref:Metalloregulator ArsR/SmtB family transcription factor n=1 Tax=Paenibacillus lacisoli TaxID=3064525 RepID=A0ABT9CJY8_9BACL|nr:metalloregulator ArsR/SmtB family transcription factor [Paenibacillus sp. JX-17]MDO7907933.1 metalloregulator ArsR/SmtB family transcription factor [Paenibacillus sp. JX-17]